MPTEPSRVWLVREGDPHATEGALSLAGTDLVFSPLSSEGGLTLPISQLTGVRRRRGAPLLTLVVVTPEGKERLFLYFAKPPPLPGDRESSPALVGTRGLARSAAALTFHQVNRLLKAEIDAWVRALREAGG